MPKIEVSEDQILQAIEGISPKARTEALRRILRGAAFWDRVVEEGRARIEAIARERSLDWTSLTEDQREALVNEIAHEK